MGLFDKLFGRSSAEKTKTSEENANKYFQMARSFEAGINGAIDLEKAEEYYRRAIAEGHQTAPVNLGVLLSVTEKQCTDAEKWIRIAANAGNSIAQYKLGCLIYENDEDDYDQALEWFIKASDNGNSSASNIAGAIYLEKAYDDAGKEKAKSYFEKAWRQGNQNAVVLLTQCCYSLKDYEGAMKWAEVGANADEPDAHYILATLHADNRCAASQGIDKAIPHFEAASALGHARSSYWLAEYYQGKHGGSADQEKSQKYMSLAVQQGHPGAQYEMALYGFEHFGKEGYQSSLQLLMLAASKNHPEACWLLGTHYLNGTGVEQDDRKALHYFTIASEQNIPMAQLDLAMMMIRGQGTEANPAKGIALLESLADDETTLDKVRRKAKYQLARIHRMGYSVETNVDRAVSLFAEAAAMGEPEAMYELARHYAQGEGLGKDYDMCRYWLERATENGCEAACHMLGVMHEHGIGMEADPESAIIYYKAAADSNHADALFRLYEIYHNGELGEECNMDAAFDYLAKAVDAHSPEAMCELGVLYYTGNDELPQDFDKARKWFEKAAQEDSGKAYYYLGVIYARGDGVRQDFAESRRLSNIALELGCDNAQKTIDVLDENGV